MSPQVPYLALDETRTACLLEGAKLVEKDRFGPKVYELPGERMLKLFRVKRLFSSNLWSPYARRFLENSCHLEKMQIPSVRCLQWGRLPDLKRQYVLYEKLQGTPLRFCESLDPAQLGKFFAGLHDRGIYFRSCHLGNVLRLDDGELGLIDIMDMHFCGRPLSDRERERNFRHLRRLPRDRERLEKIWKHFLEAYTKG